MKKTIKTPFAAAMGTAVISALAVNVAQAEANPFAMTELSSGYMQTAEAKVSNGGCAANVKSQQDAPKADKKAEGSCGEGMCGGMMQGGKMKQGMESMCGAMMKGHEGSCGMNAGAAKKEAQGSCGAMMNGGDKKGMEHLCGAMMKGGEGSCGSKVDAEKAAGH